MIKKLLIITAAGLISFSGAFVFGWLIKPPPASPPDEPSPSALTEEETIPELPLPRAAMMSSVGTVTDREQQTMTEEQLKDLVFEVREKIQEYNDKLQYLKVQEQRLQMSQDTLRKDIEELNNLRIELASIVVNIKNERDKLLKSRLEVNQAEKANLVSIAATYDQMDSASAGKILISMCSSQTQPDKVDIRSSGFDEAVKILHYMKDRTKAKLLAELTTTEPKLAAFLTQRLKQIIEGN